MEHGSIYSGRDYGLGSDVMSQGTSDEVPRLVIAVDYGTTYTGKYSSIRGESMSL